MTASVGRSLPSGHGTTRCVWRLLGHCHSFGYEEVAMVADVEVS
jgi:hypothetical protein